MKIIAVCGLPNADPRHAQRCVQAAIDILRFKEERSRRERVFGIRIGTVVAGIVGVRKFDYDIWGDTVNTAAYMEQHGEPGENQHLAERYELVKDVYRCNYRGQIVAKNEGEVELYLVSVDTVEPVG